MPIVFPLVVAAVGALLYLRVASAKWLEIGRLMFVVGLFWLVYLLDTKPVLRIFGG